MNANLDQIDLQFDLSSGHSHDGTDSPKISYNDLNDLPSGSGYAPWTEFTSGIDTTPESISTITTSSDLRGVIKVGYPLKHTRSGHDYYGVVTAITSSLITIAGAGLFGTITAIYYADTTRTEQISIHVAGYYADDVDFTLLQNDKRMNGGLINRRGPMYIVQVIASNIVSDSGETAAAVNVLVGPEILCADLPVGTSENASGVEIDYVEYEWNTGEAIEIIVTPGDNGDAEDLCLDLVAVIP
jgi:hypothetical protein